MSFLSHSSCRLLIYLLNTVVLSSVLKLTMHIFRDLWFENGIFGVFDYRRFQVLQRARHHWSIRQVHLHHWPEWLRQVELDGRNLIRLRRKGTKEKWQFCFTYLLYICTILFLIYKVIIRQKQIQRIIFFSPIFCANLDHVNKNITISWDCQMIAETFLFNLI